MRWVKRSFWYSILIVVILFAAMNMERVDITLLPFAPTETTPTALTLPLAFVIFFTLLIGLFVGVMLENDRERPYRRELNAKTRELNKVRSELAKLQSAVKQADHAETAALLLPRR